MTKSRIAVVGAGLMGHGIAQVFALAGHDVAITDSHAPLLDTVKPRIAANLRDLGENERAVERVHLHSELANTVADAEYVFEAVSENLSIKQKLFAEIEAHVGRDTVLASNTSVIPITSIMQDLRRRERAVGTHWWNPPYLVPLVEVIETRWTVSDVVARTMTLLAAVGKKPARVKKDVPGFIGNRLQHALWREAIALVEENICDAETVDSVVKASFGLRLSVLGPLENADMVGTDLTLAIHNVVLPAINSRPGPSPYLEKLVAENKLGFKTDEGFRKWSPQQKETLRKTLTQHLRATQRAENKNPTGKRSKASDEG